MYTLGFDKAGFIVHVTNGTKECCKITAKQIRRHYKSVKIVDDDVGSMLIDADLHKRIREQHKMQEAMLNDTEGICRA